MEFYSFFLLVALIATAHFYFQERNKRKVAFTVHVQGRTEEAETLDFGITLFSDEDENSWLEKMNQALTMTEKRRAYNNDRMMKLMKDAEEKRKEAQRTKLVGNS